MRQDTYLCIKCGQKRRQTLRFWQALDDQVQREGIADVSVCPDCRVKVPMPAWCRAA